MSWTNSLNALFFRSNLLYSIWASSKLELYMEYNYKQNILNKKANHIKHALKYGPLFIKISATVGFASLYRIG